MRRVILIVLDSFGIGELPDANKFGDFGVNTIKACSGSEFFSLPNMQNMGLFNIDGVETAGDSLKVPQTTGAYARLAESSMGKDTTIGHWEIAGLISHEPMPTYPDGFPQDVLDEFEKQTGRKAICNKPYSGTKCIADYGEEHMKTGALIVYTSADSVFQIAAHEDIVPVEELYRYCEIARKILQPPHGVGRVIARPFVGTPGNFERTARRHDFSLEPTGETMLDRIKAAGLECRGVGKIYDIFAGVGITKTVRTEGNADGIEKTLAWMKEDFEGLLFVNLVDFDMLYGHRRDIDGYAKALTYFDSKLPEIVELMNDDDILMITADHGCDPSYLETTDHTREYVPLLMYGKNVKPENLGTKPSYAFIADTVEKYLLDLE